MSRIWALVLAGLMATGIGPAMAETGAPRPWEIGLQEPASTSMEQIYRFHNLMMVIITLIVLFVLGLLVYVMYRYNAKRNPVPSKTTHHTLVEVIWTVVPVVILVGVALPSFRLLYYLDKTADPEMTLKAIGHQWYWSYEYPDQGSLAFDSNLIPTDQLKEGQLRDLSVDNVVVLPVDTNIRILTTATDVIHSFAIPAFGIKKDAVPGRTNETWVRITKTGTYYGQCSELCGQGHGFMPIEVKAVSKDEFSKWLQEAKQKFARSDGAPSPTRLAAADRAR